MLYDLSLDQLRGYRPERREPGDFDAFWEATLEAARQFPLSATFRPVNYGLSLVRTYDVMFAGFGGDPIRGWLLLPAGAPGRLPCVVEYIGYGGGRGYPADWLFWSSAGYAHFVMDTRGQGSVWSRGDTPDPGALGDPQVPGFMTRGILDPASYYYRRVFTDAVRAVEAARSHPGIDPERVAVTGGSQGGGITLAVAGMERAVAAVMPDVPFLCHYRAAVELVDTYPYREISQFCQIHRDKVDQVFATLAYFDGVHFASRARAPALFSAGLMDDICPPRTVFAAYNHYAGPKDIRVWEFNRHEGGGSEHTLQKLSFLARLWGHTPVPDT